MRPYPAQTLHLLTIGQAPRPDVVPEIVGFVGSAAAEMRVVEAGALDGLSREEIRSGAPGPGEMPLVSRLRSGEEVIVGERFVEKRLAALVEQVPEGDLAAILCTGPFAGIPERPGLVKAGPVFDQALRAACFAGGAVGMLIPDLGQEADARRRVPAGSACIVAVASPYADAGVAERLPQRFREAEVIGLNCLGYGGLLAREIGAATGKPVVLARRALAEAVRRAATR